MSEYESPSPKSFIPLDSPISVLSPGNIVSIGIQLARLHFGDYFNRSFLAHLWLGLGLMGSVLLLGLGLAFGFGLDALLSTQGFFVVAGVGVGGVLAIAVILYAVGWMTATGGIMTRMGVNTLRHRYEPGELYKQTIQRRIWAYAIAVTLFSVSLLLTYGLILAVAALAIVVILPSWEGFYGAATPQLQGTLALGAVISGLLLFLGLGMTGYYLAARLWFFDAVLVLEPERSPLEALLRSWELTQGKGWSVTTVMFATSLLTLPLSVIASLVNVVVPFVSFLIGVLFFPLWQAVKAANYYDLAAAKSGLIFDLGTPPPNPRQWLRRVAIQTPEGIALDFALAGPGSRALAWMIDQVILYLLLTALVFIGALIYGYVLFPFLTDQFPDSATDDLNLWAGAIATLIGFVVANGYFIYCETFRRGQTPGKQISHIRVVRDDGQPIGVREATLRSFVGWIDLGFFVIGLMLIMLNRSEKRLGDFAAGTLVIQDEQIAKQQQTLAIPNRFSRLTEDTVEVLTQQTDPTLLSVNQYLTVRNFLGCRDQLSARDRAQVTQRLAQQLRSFLMPTSPELLGTIPDESLIEAVYLVNRSAYSI